jgi:chromosome segregation ATPase
MPKTFSLSFQRKLISYGILPTIYLSSLYLHADEPKKTESLVILEGRQQGKIPEGANLQQKVQTLSSLAKEQSARIQGLHDEVKNLRDKLHLSQISNDAGSPRQLYTALKQESAKNKETQNQLNQIIQQLAADNAAEQQRNQEADQQITTLMSALSAQTAAIEKIENDHKQELDRIANNAEEEGRYKSLYAMLEQESEQYKKTQNELEGLIQKQKNENAEEKQKLANAEKHIDNLLAALNEQTYTIDSIHQDYQSQIEQLSGSVTEAQNYKTFHDALEQDLNKNKDAKNELERLVLELKQENENERNRIVEAEANVGSLLSHLTASQEEALKQFEKTQEQLTTNKNKIAEYEVELNTAKYTISQLEEAINFQKDLLEARNSELENSVPKDKFAENSVELQEHKSAVAGLREELDQNKQLVAILQDEQQKFAQTQAELKEYQQLHAHAVNLYDELHTEHYSANQLLSKLQNELAESKEDHLTDLDQLDAEIKKLSDLLSSERSDSLTLQNQLSAIENDYERELARHNELKAAYEQSLEHIADLQQANQDLEQQHIQHEQEKHEMQQKLLEAPQNTQQEAHE